MSLRAKDLASKDPASEGPTSRDPTSEAAKIKALALTSGEPAGIGPDIALAAWLQRKELDLPPFYLLGDRAFFAEHGMGMVQLS